VPIIEGKGKAYFVETKGKTGRICPGIIKQTRLKKKVVEPGATFKSSTSDRKEGRESLGTSVYHLGPRSTTFREKEEKPERRQGGKGQQCSSYGGLK